MSEYRIDAIIALYSNVGTIDCNGVVCDKDGNDITSTLDEDAITAKEKELPTVFAWEALRERRKLLLKETDWMANSDVTMSDAWKTYRQALRDLPANTSDPANPTWPTKPS